MTMDVTIGKVTNEGVIMCPKSKSNICNSEFTFAPKDAYRSGSTEWRYFWVKNPILDQLYGDIKKKYPNTDDCEWGKFTKRYIFLFDKMNEEGLSSADKDRMIWIKYWTKKAIELYGEDAGIMFS